MHSALAKQGETEAYCGEVALTGGVFATAQPEAGVTGASALAIFYVKEMLRLPS